MPADHGDWSAGRAVPDRRLPSSGRDRASKITVIEMLEGLQRPSAGRVRVLGMDPVGDLIPVGPRAGAMRQDVGVRLGGWL
jgi:ABC-type uncharacterized transport system ATPase subunit